MPIGFRLRSMSFVSVGHTDYPSFDCILIVSKLDQPKQKVYYASVICANGQQPHEKVRFDLNMKRKIYNSYKHIIPI